MIGTDPSQHLNWKPVDKKAADQSETTDIRQGLTYCASHQSLVRGGCRHTLGFFAASGGLDMVKWAMVSVGQLHKKCW